MVAQMFGNEGVNNLTILVNGFQLVRQSKFNLHVPAITFTFVFIGGLEKYFRVVMRPFGQTVRMEDTTAAFLKRFFAIYVLDMSFGRRLHFTFLNVFQN